MCVDHAGENTTTMDGWTVEPEPDKHFTDMMEFIVPTMIVYGLFTLVGISGKCIQMFYEFNEIVAFIGKQGQ